MINNQARVENRRNWKGEVVDYDAIKAYAERECSYCLTDAQVAVLAGVIEPLGWATRWQSDTQPIDPSWVEEFRNDIQRRLAMSCCGDETPIQYRWNEDGELEKSSDGGETWEAAPQDDPRNNSTIFPPIPGADGSDKMCNAATGAAQLVKEQVGDQLTDDMARYTLQQLIEDWVGTMVQTSNIFEALIRVATNQIFALVIAVVRPALTDPVYHQLACILNCHIATDASFSDAGWEAVRSDILNQITGVAGIFLEHLVYMLGRVGLTNLARNAPAASGDCSDCECVGNWCLNYDFTTSDYGISWLYGTYTPGVGIVATAAGTGVSIVGSITWGVNTQITFAGMTTAEPPNRINAVIADNAFTEILLTQENVVNGYHYNGDLDYAHLSSYAITFNPSSGADQGGQTTLTHAEFHGTGVLPPGAELCDI
jgi:hypothetical protein